MNFFNNFLIIAVCCYGTFAQEFLTNISYEIVKNTDGDIVFTFSPDDQPDEVGTTTTLEVELSNVTSKVPDEEPVVTTKLPDVGSITVTTDSPSEQPISDTTQTPDVPVNCTTKVPVLDEKILGMNIGLFYILEELRRKVDAGHHPTEILIKALVISQKIERHHGEVIALNKERMKILSKAVPRSFKEAVCS